MKHYVTFTLIIAVLFLSACAKMPASPQAIVLPSSMSQSPSQSVLGLNSDAPSAETLKAQIGLEFNDIYAGILAEPTDSSFIYFYKGNGGEIYQYNKLTKKFTRMNWHVRPQGSNDTLSHDQRFMLGLNLTMEGEVRSLLLTDFAHGTQKEIEKLTPPSTYTQFISEFDGSPVGSIELANSPTSTFRVAVYLDNPELSVLSGDRNAIATKTIYAEQY